MKRIQPIEELSMDAQASVHGGEIGASCATTCQPCSCECGKDEPKSTISTTVKKNVKSLTIMVHNNNND